MDIKSQLTQCLQAPVKHLPVWYRYDKQGSIYNDRCLYENKFYYFYDSEIASITKNVQDIVSQVATPCVLVEMGSGNSEKSRSFINAILEKQGHLQYIPVDISEEFLDQCSKLLSKEYGHKLDVQQIPGDYDVGIQQIKTITEHKLIIWLGGGFQNQPYNTQVSRLQSLAQAMSESDRLLIALDVTQDAQTIENAYLDPTGISALLYLNAIQRLNREFGSDIDCDKFDLEARFERNTDPDSVSRLVLLARAKCDLNYHIPGLAVFLSFRKGECLRLHEGEGVSCKYTKRQIQTLGEKGGFSLVNLWTDDNNHVALCCLSKRGLSIGS